MVIRSILSALIILAVASLAYHSPSTYSYGLLIVQGGFAVAWVLVGRHVELDLERMRYRQYWFRILARESEFKPLPHLDHIHVRDITYPGGREDSSADSWGDTYAYELSLMSVAKEKLVLCVRPGKRTIINYVGLLQERTGLRVRDVTKEQIMTADRK